MTQQIITVISDAEVTDTYSTNNYAEDITAVLFGNGVYHNIAHR